VGVQVIILTITFSKMALKVKPITPSCLCNSYSHFFVNGLYCHCLVQLFLSCDRLINLKLVY